MGRVNVVLSVLGLSLISLAQTSKISSPFTGSAAADLQRRSALPARADSQVQTPRLLTSTSPDVVPTPCPSDAIAAAAAAGVAVLCGYLPVPFDRVHPKQGNILLYFEQYLHNGSGAAESAILVESEIGRSAANLRQFYVPILTPNFDLHDVLLVDNRGSGRSGVIDCEEMQFGTSPAIDELVDCAAQLGITASWYGSGDIARDMEAVRTVLGYDLLDLYGQSAGGPAVLAYASRFGEHIRTIVLDSPYGGGAFRDFALVESKKANAEPRMVRLDCQRSPTCSRDHPNPEAELEQLIRALRKHPVEGYGYNSGGNLIPVRIDEPTLLNYLLDNPTGNFTDTGELLAAGTSLANGDFVPLLRLGAESIQPLAQNLGDPTIFSAGSLVDTSCIDLNMPWDWHVPMNVRFAQYKDALEDLPDDYFAPFSKNAATTLEFSLATNCMWWQKPSPSSPVLPPQPQFPNVPTLIFSGDLDNAMPLEETKLVAGFFPSSTLVKFAEVGHVAAYWSQCAFNLTSQFIETPGVTDFSCAEVPPIVWAAVGRFPVVANDARPAAPDPGGTNQIGIAERKVVTVAVAAATDAMQRSFLNVQFASSTGIGAGLRGGTFQTDFSNPNLWVTSLTNCAFAQDVIVSGVVSWGIFAPPFTADLTVTGPGTAGGALHIDGVWQTPGPVGSFTVSGTLGGRNVAVLVPEQ